METKIVKCRKHCVCLDIGETDLTGEEYTVTHRVTSRAALSAFSKQKARA